MTSRLPAWKRIADQLERMGKHMTKTPKIPTAAEAKKSAQGRARPGAEMALAKSAFEASVPPETRDVIAKGKAVVVVIHAPAPDWVSPISAYVATMTEAKRFARDGSQKSKDLPTEGNDQVVAALSDGRSVIGISHDPDRHLPSALIAAADITVAVRQPDGTTLMNAIVSALGGRGFKRPPEDLGAGLAFADLAAALRPGSKPGEAVVRLLAAGKGRSLNAAPRSRCRLWRRPCSTARPELGALLSRPMSPKRKYPGIGAASTAAPVSTGRQAPGKHS